MARTTIVGEKVGMTQLWDDQNNVVSVTVVKVQPARVVQVKTPDRDGYAAVQITYGTVKPSRLTRPEAGHFAAAGVAPGSELLEFRVDDAGAWAIGQEIAADAFAFVHTGYAAVASLHDVVAGSTGSVIQYNLGDPHPISYLRVLLGLEMCRQWFGLGPWDDLETSWTGFYQPRNRSSHGAQVIESCLPVLPQAVAIILKQRYRAFGQKALSDVIDPRRVKPQELYKLEHIAGPGLFTNHGWIWKEALRLLALSGLKIATSEHPADEYKRQEEWMQKLGWSVNLN